LACRGITQRGNHCTRRNVSFQKEEIQMRHFVSLLVVLMCTLTAAAPAGAQATPACQFVLGFAALHDMLPTIVGNCLEDEQHNPTNGDALQHTTGINGNGGLLVWRKADNFTAFTDGSHSWVNGPFGVEERLNSRRFSWEANPDGLPVVATSGTGIQGTVTLGPTTPVCRVGVPCSRAVAATVTVQDAGGQQVLQFTTGADGQFQVNLAPGTYTLTPAPLQSGSFYPRPLPVKVTVTSGSYAQVNPGYDTGIR
jgi:hypothetical protein